MANWLHGVFTHTKFGNLFNKIVCALLNIWNIVTKCGNNIFLHSTFYAKKWKACEGLKPNSFRLKKSIFCYALSTQVQYAQITPIKAIPTLVQACNQETNQQARCIYQLETKNHQTYKFWKNQSTLARCISTLICTLFK